MRTCLLVVFACLLGAGSGARGADRESVPGVDAKWRRYQSPHFELFSHNGGSESRQVLHNLELLHTVFLDTLHLSERQPLEVTVFYFATDREFNAYLTPQMRRNGGLAGYYLARADRAVIVLSPQIESAEAQRVINHEYIHHLTFITGDTPALWYREGIAELFSTIEEDAKGLKLGLPIENHVGFLQQGGMMPLEDLFSTGHDSPNYNESERMGYFYAESWALLHFWLFGRSNLPRAPLDRFLRYSLQDEGNLDPPARRELFQSTLGMTYEAMLDRLRRYVNSGSYSWSKLPLPKMAPRESYAVRPVDRDEIREQLVELDLRVNRSPQSRLTLLDAAGKSSANPRLFEVLGTDALAEGDESAARERWQQALAAGTTNPAISHELALLENRRWFSDIDVIYFRLPADTAQYLRGLLRRSIASAPDQIQAYEMLAWVEATVDAPSAANVNLVQTHFGGLKDKNRTLLALALVRVRLKEEAAARELLDSLEKREPNRDILQAVTTVRAYLDAQHPPAP
jgi:hypothetical protein